MVLSINTRTVARIVVMPKLAPKLTARRSLTSSPPLRTREPMLSANEPILASMSVRPACTELSRDTLPAALCVKQALKVSTGIVSDGRRRQPPRNGNELNPLGPQHGPRKLHARPRRRLRKLKGGLPKLQEKQRKGDGWYSGALTESISFPFLAGKRRDLLSVAPFFRVISFRSASRCP